MRRRAAAIGSMAMIMCALAGCASADLSHYLATSWASEQTNLVVRDPSALAPTPLPNIPPPPTVAVDSPPREPYNLSLNEAIRIAIDNSRVVRTFTGLGAANSGSTIYDVAITNTRIDQQQARFDPTLTTERSLTRDESPQFGIDLTRPTGIGTVGARGDTERTAAGLQKVNPLGGTTSLNFANDRTTLSPARDNLNPVNRSALEFAYTQPLLQGAGFQVNLAPIILARLDTERSYFQFKDATQELVRGTIEAYWNLVLARIDLWAAEIQNRQAEEAFKRAEARQKAEIDNLSNVSQAKVTLNQFRAAFVAARAAVLDREAALRNLIGLSPSDGREIIPVSALTNQRFRADWENIVRLAEQRRPDIIELKLILEADQQRRIQAENLALPRVDATTLYRWNGLSGRLPDTGERIASEHGQFTDWTVGINFSVPLGLREGRARVREQDLIILRDQANLQQGLHAAGHDLAITTRSLESSYEQYLAFREAHLAARTNVMVQFDYFNAGTVIYLIVLQALNDWGNAVRSEARALVDYNILLANLERQTGTILETHGLVFIEERFRAAGPLCLPTHDRAYPAALKPAGEPTRFPDSGRPGENAFDLTDPTERKPKAKLKGPQPADEKEELPPPRFKFAEEQAK